jgi:hypothetical protein
MSSMQRCILLGRRLWPVALIGAVLAVAAAGPSPTLAASAGKHHRGQAQTAQQPQQVIDAQANPQAAGDALNDSTGSPSWQTDTAPGGCTMPPPTPPDGCVPADKGNTTHYTITDGYGPFRIIGDVLYNCSEDQYAETAVGISDERMETTSLSEKVSVKISLKLLDTVGISTEFSAFSKQATSVSTTVSVENAVAVPPLNKGWTLTQVKTAKVPGSAYVTDGIGGPLVEVTNMDLSFPGYQLNPNETTARYIGYKTPMTDDEISTICNTNPVDSALSGRRVVGAGPTLRRAPSPSKFKLRLCGRSGRCTSREVTGSLPPSRIRRATATLTRAGHTYGRGSYTRAHTQLRMRRPLTAGTYKLTLVERPPASQRIGPGRLSAINTILPITIG